MTTINAKAELSALFPCLNEDAVQAALEEQLIRQAAIQCCHSLIELHGDGFTPEHWQHLPHEAVKELLDRTAADAPKAKGQELYDALTDGIVELNWGIPAIAVALGKPAIA